MTTRRFGPYKLPLAYRTVESTLDHWYGSQNGPYKLPRFTDIPIWPMEKNEDFDQKTVFAHL